MDKNLNWKIILIIVLVVLAALRLYPPSKTLKPGIDLAGGTSLIYEINSHGLSNEDKKDLSQRMITILRRRIDPANIQNLIWRPQGNTRFEIQMPLANAEARQKRLEYKNAEDELLSENINPAIIMHSLVKAPEERVRDFNDFSKADPNKLAILNNLAQAYDEQKELQSQRDSLNLELESIEGLLESANLNVEQIQLGSAGWSKLDSQQLVESLRGFLAPDNNTVSNVDNLTTYVKKYSEWADVVGQLTDVENGKNIIFKDAKRELSKLSLTEDQLSACFDLLPKSALRREAVEHLKTEFKDRKDKIVKVVEAFDNYRRFRGGLDDPKDLQRMLKGAGILEFRILPTLNPGSNPEMIDVDELPGYLELLKEKGPKFASDNRYVWCEIEDIKEWKVSSAIVGQFGDKFYVLASNKTDEAMLRSSKKSWKLRGARASQDQMGRRAIAFSLDERGGGIFGTITSKNKDRPLCIILDGMAISAPNIESRITTSGIITGSFTQMEVADMVNKLNAGSLPARLIEQPISVKTIGPSIGVDNRDKGIKAGIIGFIIVVGCMAAYYTLAGAIADVALFMNLLFVLAIMALVSATFTLPGIAGIILTIGMSVDANVLIFERIREEQEKGSSLRIAIRNGYQRAFQTIFDANLTTFITAAILFWVASEEIKGFAIVLMLGIASSMFTALFATRVIFDTLLNKKLIKDHLFMLRLIKKPNINWMALRPVFLTVSAALILGGLAIFFMRDNVQNNKYDIEFTGGTSVQINLKENVELTREDVLNRMRQIGEKLNNSAIMAANVYSIGDSNKQYEINTTETNKTTATIKFAKSGSHTDQSIVAGIKKMQRKLGGKLSNLAVTQNEQNPAEFVVTTSQTNKSFVENVLTKAFADPNISPDTVISEPVVDEIVNNAILTAFEGELEILQNLQPTIESSEKITEALIDSYPELAEYIGGLKIVCKNERTATTDEIITRFKDLLFKPDMQNLKRYPYTILGSDLKPLKSGEMVNEFVYLSVEPEAGYRELTPQELEQFTENETTKVLAAAKLETSLPRVTQIDPSVGAEAKTRALIAIVLSLGAIILYVWIRFGTARYGFAAIVALVHDVCITLGAVVVCTYIAQSTIGKALLIGDFKINLAMIAAFLTLIGYSLNDTIVVFDRIRENRHKKRLLPNVINDSINQTISRTILTSFTTFIVVLIMYIFGGQGLRGFTFAIGFGIIVGTYSSVAIAAPILLLGSKGKKDEKKK